MCYPKNRPFACHQPGSLACMETPADSCVCWHLIGLAKGSPGKLKLRGGGKVRGFIPITSGAGCISHLKVTTIMAAFSPGFILPSSSYAPSFLSLGL